MTENIAAQRLQDAWKECQRHLHYLNYALSTLAHLLPLSGDELQTMSDEDIQSLDQFVLRFGKLQDAMGNRLMPSILDYLQEPFENRPMLDKLHRLEKLGYLADSAQWQTLRAIRNRFAHEYPDDPDKNAALLNMAIYSTAELIEILERMETRLQLTGATI
jgi:hypothetical protein